MLVSMAALLYFVYPTPFENDFGPAPLPPGDERCTDAIARSTIRKPAGIKRWVCDERVTERLYLRSVKHLRPQ